MLGQFLYLSIIMLIARSAVALKGSLAKLSSSHVGILRLGPMLEKNVLKVFEILRLSVIISPFSTNGLTVFQNVLLSVMIFRLNY